MDDYTDQEIRELWLERAAIIELDGGLTRKQAAYNAAREVKRMIGRDLPEAIVEECRKL